MDGLRLFCLEGPQATRVGGHVVNYHASSKSPLRYKQKQEIHIGNARYCKQIWIGS